MRYPQWIEDLYTAAAVTASGFATATSAQSINSIMITMPPAHDKHFVSDDSNNTETSPLPVDQIKKFLAKNFTHIPLGVYYTKKTHSAISEEQMISLIQAYPRTQQLPDSYKKKIKDFVTGELAPQVLNLLEISALLTAIWVNDPEYVVGAASWSVIAALSGMTIWSNHLYYGLVAGKTPDEVQKTIADGDAAVQKMRQTFGDNAALFQTLTQPHFGWRLAQELRSLSALTVKTIASFALFFQMNKQMHLNLSVYVLSLLALTAGMVQGVDMGFSNTIAISHEHQKFSEYRCGLIPPDLNDRGFRIFLRLADFSFFPWLMATSGPAMWATIKFMASQTLFDLISEKSDQVRGGLLGAELITGISSMYFAYIFLQYNILEKLAKELPTKRTFKLCEGTVLNRMGQATIATLPAGALALFVAHQSGCNATLIALPAATITMAAILFSEKFAQYYSNFTRLGFVGDVVNKLDAIDIKDKIAAFILSLVTAGVGIYKDQETIAAIGQLLTFLTLTLLVAEYSRPLAAALRFIPAQMALYTAALITWQLVFIGHMTNPHAKNFPTHLSNGRQELWYYPNVVGALTAAAAAGFGDHKAQGLKVADVQKPLDNKLSSLLGCVSQTFWGCLQTMKEKCLGVESTSSTAEHLIPS